MRQKELSKKAYLDTGLNPEDPEDARRIRFLETAAIRCRGNLPDMVNYLIANDGLILITGGSLREEGKLRKLFKKHYKTSPKKFYAEYLKRKQARTYDCAVDFGELGNMPNDMQRNVRREEVDQNGVRDGI